MRTSLLKTRILIVGANEHRCWLLVDEFTDNQHQTFATDNPTQVLQLVEKYHPDLIIWDMPFNHDENFSSWKNFRETRCGIPVVAFSNNSIRESWVVPKLADYYVKKRSGLVELKKTIKSVLREKNELRILQYA